MQETHQQKKMRQAHVVIRAFDSVIWADPRDEAAVTAEVNRLFHLGLLYGIELPESIEERLTPSHRKSYQLMLEEARRETAA